MGFRREWIPNYIDLDDQDLLNQIEILKKEVEDTKLWIDESINEKGPMEYMNKRVAELAYSFACEKYRLFIDEARRRGILN